MASPKYIAANVAFTSGQLEVIETYKRAAELELGIKLSRSQAIVFCLVRLYKQLGYPRITSKEKASEEV